jgi:proliferating cell nuclear antigen
MAIELQLADAIQFRNAIHALSEHIQTANFQFTQRGLSVSEMDNSHTCLLSYVLSEKDCALYKCDAPRIIGLHTSLLEQVLRMTHSGEELTMTIPLGSDTISILLVHKGLSLRRTFELPTLDITLDEIDIPELNLQADITMSTSDFVGCMKQFHKINADNVVLQLNEEGFTVEASGTMKATCLFEAMDGREMAMEGTCVRQEYSFKLVHGIVSAAADLSSTIQISFEKEKPVRFTFLFGLSKFITYTAPKIVDD